MDVGRSALFGGVLDFTKHAIIVWHSALFFRKIASFLFVVVFTSFNTNRAMEIPLFNLIESNNWNEEVGVKSSLGFQTENKEENEFLDSVLSVSDDKPNFEQISIKHKRRKKTSNPLAPEEFKKLVMDICVKNKCLLCVRGQLKKQKGVCPNCLTIYVGVNPKINDYKLFMHWVKSHHSAGEYIYQYSNPENNCNFGCTRSKPFKDHRDLSSHIIAKHVCGWVQENHRKNCKYE